MNIFSFINHIKSFNRVKVTTLRPEKILNLMSLKGISASEISYEQGVLSFTILNSSVKQLNELLSNNLGNAEVSEIFGAQKLFSVVRKRSSILIGAFLAVFFIVFLSGRIMNIKIYPSESRLESEIISCLYELGIKQLTRKSRVDCEALRFELLNRFDSLGDVQVDFHGTSLYIALSEKESPIIIFDSKVPVDLIASRDATVDVIEVYSGTAAVKAGDKVKKGDVLIHGYTYYGYELEEQKAHSVHAMGKVLARERSYFEDITLNAFNEPENAPYLSEKTFKLFSKTITVQKEYEKESCAVFSSENQYLKIAVIQLPVLYDEKKIYNIAECERKSEGETQGEISALVQKKLGVKAKLISLSYTLTPTSDNRLSVCAEALYYESISEQRAFDESSLPENKLPEY